jgi:hypothetical protein
MLAGGEKSKCTNRGPDLLTILSRYFSLFIACNLAAAVIYFFFLPETVSLYGLYLYSALSRVRTDCMMQGGKSLEEIAALFGDEMAVENIDDVDPNDKVLPTAKHVEVETGNEKSKV